MKKKKQLSIDELLALSESDGNPGSVNKWIRNREKMKLATLEWLQSADPAQRRDGLTVIRRLELNLLTETKWALPDIVKIAASDPEAELRTQAQDVLTYYHYDPTSL